MTTCRQCHSEFEITDQDRRFYESVSPVIDGVKYPIPNPTLCPQCRFQRRIIWRPELNLFKRKSDLSGETIVSLYPQEADAKVYSNEAWWSDNWDPLDYGRDFDFSRPFFDQFADLVKVVPLPALMKKGNENCDYINSASWNKNCYLIAGSNFCEDCYYGNFLNGCRNCIDNNFVDKSELCYECVDSKNCYNLKYSFNCHNCYDSAFLYNCKACHNCFGSVNLVEKKYFYLNEQLSKEDYEKRIAELELHKRSRVEEMRQFIEQYRLKYPYKYMLGEQNENVSGSGINHCRDTFECFDVSELENCKYCTWLHQSKNCMDIYAWGFPATESYECLEVGDRSYHVLFSVSTYNGTNVYYSYYSMSDRDIFGYVSLRNKQYCILNKQYSKEEYEKLVPKIIEHMRKPVRTHGASGIGESAQASEVGSRGPQPSEAELNNKEWGEFFPMRVSPLAYNQTIAEDYVPISKGQAVNLGAKWSDEPPTIQKPAEKTDIPDSIHDADKSICEKTLICEKTGKPFKIIPQEFKFYKENNIPIPACSPMARYKARLARRTPRRLWDRKCGKCGTDIRTSYPPDRPETVYCEKCYLEEVY